MGHQIRPGTVKERPGRKVIRLTVKGLRTYFHDYPADCVTTAKLHYWMHTGILNRTTGKRLKLGCVPGCKRLGRTRWITVEDLEKWIRDVGWE